MTIHPKAVHWTPSLARDGVGRVTGFQSEIGCTYRLPDGWHSECHSGPEFFGPFKSETKARAAVTNFVNNGYSR